MLEITHLPINLTPTRDHEIVSHYGTYNFYRHYLKNYPEAIKDESLYRTILRSINSRIAQKIATLPYDLKLPKHLGIIKVRKYYPEFSILEDGTCRNKMGIDFKSTIELWAEDPEARRERIKVYYENEHSDGFIFKIKYDKNHAKYRNKSVYMFKFNRVLKQMLSTNIKNKTIDAFLS